MGRKLMQTGVKNALNEIAGFFDQLYLKNGLMNFFDFLHGVTQPCEEWTDDTISLLKG